MKIQITREEAMQIYKGLLDVSKVQGAKFAYAVTRNIKMLEPLFKEISNEYAPDKEYLKYQELRAELAKKHAKVDGNGNPQIITVNGSERYDIADQALFDKEYEEFNQQHKETIDKRNAQLEAHELYMNEIVDLDVYGLKEEHLPEAITAEQLTKLYPLLDNNNG